MRVCRESDIISNFQNDVDDNKSDIIKNQPALLADVPA